MSIELRPGDPAIEKAASLMRSFDFHRGHFGAVLLGASPGRIIVDSRDSPRWTLIMPADGFAYLACETDPVLHLAEWRSLVEVEAAGKCFELMVAPILEYLVDGIFGPVSHFPVPRLSFLPPERPFGEEEAQAASMLPEGYFIEHERSASRLDLRMRGRHEEVAHCGGWIYEGEIEMDILVVEAWRRQGIGGLLGRAFLKACSEGRLKARWTCWEDNLDSARLAKSLGFHDPKTFKVNIHDEG